MREGDVYDWGNHVSRKIYAQWIFVFFLVLFSALPAFAKGHILEWAYFEDPTAQLNIEQVVEKPYTPLNSILNKGYSNSVFWVRLTVKPSDRPLFLVARPRFLDTLILYSPLAHGGWTQQVGGDGMLLSDQAIARDPHVFQINPQRTTDYYLKLQTSSSVILGVQVLTFAEWVEQSMQVQVYQIFFVSLMIAILLWATSDYVVRREKLVGWFMLTQVLQITFSLTLMGYLVVFLPTWLDQDMLTSILIQATVGVTMFFHRMLIRPFKPGRWAVRVLDLLIGLIALDVLLILVGYPGVGLQLGAVGLIIFIPTLLWLGYSTKVDALPGRIALRIAYNALALALAIAIIPLLGWGQSVGFHLNAVSMQSLVSAIIMGLFLHKRSSAMQKRAIENALKLERTEQGLIDHQNKLDEQRSFMDMLSHELKTPISVIQITLDTVTLPDRKRDRLERALRTMSDVIDRCRLSTQVDDHKLNVDKEMFDFSELVEEVISACLSPTRINLYVEPTMVDSDRQLLAVVLSNLIDNALKYSPADSTIKVDLGSEENRFVRGTTLTVSNALSQTFNLGSFDIFEKYFRGSTSTGFSGSGLGLYLCRHLIEMLGGSLSCQIFDKEIVFTLWLPDATK